MELPDVAGNVRAGLARQRKPQTLLQQRLGISRGSLHRRLTGQQPFTADELVIVADFLGVSVGDLFVSHAAEASA